MITYYLITESQVNCWRGIVFRKEKTTLFYYEPSEFLWRDFISKKIPKGCKYVRIPKKQVIMEIL